MDARALWLDRALVVGPYVALCLSKAEFRACLKRLQYPGETPDFLKTDRANATVHFIDNPDGQLCALVCLGSTAGRTPLEIAGLLVHEAVHIWQEFCDSIGERGPSREFEAYSIQCIAQRLMESFAQRAA